MERDMGKMGVGMGRHGKAIVGARKLNLHRSRFMGKMGEMGRVL
jgi:hypothetical protein